MKKECEIVRDLLPNYVEDLVGNQTKEFIETHIAECTECKEIFNNMQGNIIQESENDFLEEKVEINQIKRYRRKMTTLKIISLIFLLTIITLFISFVTIYIPKYCIISKIYDEIQENKNMNNYKFTMTQYYITSNDEKINSFTDVYYYKDGTFKSESYSNKSKKIINYGSIYNEDVIYKDYNTNIVFNNTTYPYKIKGSIFNCFNDIENYMQNKLSIINLKIKEDTYNNKDCYVILFGKSRELWIDRQIMLPIREIQKNNEKINFERTFLIEENIVIVDGRLSIREDDATTIIANEIKDFKEQKKQKLVFDISDLDEEKKAKLRGGICYFSGDKNNMQVFVKIADEEKSCGAIYVNDKIISIFREIIGIERVMLTTEE